MKRTIILVLIMSLFTSPFVFASTDYNYTDNGDGTCTIDTYIGSSATPVVPTTINGLTVTRIGNFAFNNKGISSVTLPSTLRYIGESSFTNNMALTSITFPNGLETIDRFAFISFQGTSITIPDSVTDIGDFAFYSASIQSINLSNGITVLKSNAFQYTALQSLVIPEGIEEIKAGAFANTSSLTSVTLPNSLELIEGNAFANSALSTMQLPVLPPITLGFEPKWSVSGQSDKNPSDTWDASAGDAGRTFTFYQDPISNPVTISGTPKVQETLTSTVNITNSRGNLLYQWQRSGTNIIGANNPTYTITGDDDGETIRLRIRSDATDNEGEVFSSATATVTKYPSTITQGIDPVYADKFHNWIEVQPVQDYEYIAVPSGQSISGTWSSNARITGLNDNTSYDVYQRKAADNLHYASAASNSITVHTPTRLTGTVHVNGIFRYKENLTAVVSNTNNSGTLNYQWQRNGGDIPGATGTSHYVDVDDIGTNISVEVTSTVEVDELNSNAGFVSKLVNGKKPVNPKVTRITHDYVVVKEIDGYEYRLDTGSWTDSHVLYGVQPERTYKVFQRIKESQTTLASIVSDSVTLKTPEEPPPEPKSRYIDAMLDMSEDDIRFGYTKIVDDYDLANTVIDNRHAEVIADAFSGSGHVVIDIQAGTAKNQLDITPEGLKTIKSDAIDIKIQTSAGCMEFKAEKLNTDYIEALFPNENFDIRVEINGDSTDDELKAVIESNGYKLIGEMLEYKVGLVTGYTTYPLETVSNVFLRAIPLNDMNDQYTVVWVDKDGMHHVTNVVEESNGQPTIRYKSNELGFFAVVKKKELPVVEHWSEDFVLSAISKGTAESSVVERLDEPIQRDEMITLFHKHTGFSLKEGEAFSDVEEENPYKLYIESARALGIVGGTGDNEYDPSGSMTREQLASLIYRYFDDRGDMAFGDISLKSYEDLSDVSIRAGVGLQWMVSNGYMSGKTSDRLMPQSEITVAEAITILNKLKDKFLD